MDRGDGRGFARRLCSPDGAFRVAGSARIYVCHRGEMIPAVALLLVGLVLLGLPLFVMLGAASLMSAWASGLDPAVLIIEINRLALSPNLMAIPLFTMAGTVLAAGGAPHRMIRLFNAAFGWMPGGLAVV